jgi:hypothetical protein
VLIITCVILTYFRAKLNWRSLDIIIQYSTYCTWSTSDPNSKSLNILSDSPVKNILRLGLLGMQTFEIPSRQVPKVWACFVKNWVAFQVPCLFFLIVFASSNSFLHSDICSFAVSIFSPVNKGVRKLLSQLKHE